ncbi:MAG: DUF983 domain-containing protein [Candidatus Binatia bacterium]
MARLIPLRRPPLRARLAAVAGGRCPRCNRGAIFAGRVRMHARCPVCELRFEREAGYFTGAMYVNYILAVPVMAVLAGIVHLLAPAWSFEATIGAGALLFLPLVPAIFRYSRILWIHFDQAIDPSERA